MLCPLLLAALAPLLQAPPPAPPLPGAKESQPVDPAILALVPGAIPAGATAAAREDWKKLEAATFVPGSQRAPITAFDLSIDIRYKRNAAGSNDLKAVYRYLAPGFVRIDLENSSTMRGPKGDWLEAPARKEKIDLAVAREHAEDRRQLDETLSVARHFIALSAPGSLRIASLEKLAEAPQGLPKPLEERSKKLAWLRLRSPDFRLVGAGAMSAMSRATIGFAPETGRVEIALVEEDKPGLAPTARVVELAGKQEAQGYVIPKQIRVFSIEDSRLPLAFTAEPGMDLYVLRANLQPALTAADFQPK
ncbi:MAG: hypothetical protein ACKVXR_07625 [Planctomycetota bacterium]